MCRRVRDLLRQEINESVSRKRNRNERDTSIIDNFSAEQALHSLNSNIIEPKQSPIKARKLNNSKKEPNLNIQTWD